MRTLAALSLVFALQGPATSLSDPAAAIASLAAALRTRYIDLDVAERMNAAVDKDHKDGVYARLTTRAEFAQALTKTLLATSHDRHLRVVDGPPPTAALAAKPVVGRVEILAGNIGYLEVPSVAQPPGAVAAQLAAAMKTLAPTSALIIDIRGNGGGIPSTVALFAAYFLDPGPVVLGTIRNRFLGTEFDNATPVNVDGPRYGTTKPVYVLIDRRSASGAESLAYTLQALKRATIVGEQSAGAANPGAFVPLVDNYWAFIPTGRVTNPITHSNWEGTGVTPAIKTESAGALDAALAAARAKAGGRERAMIRASPTGAAYARFDVDAPFALVGVRRDRLLRLAVGDTHR